MKHIIYLDTGFLNSYLSQIYDGLIKSKRLESGDQTNQNQETSEIEPTLKSSAGLKGFFSVDISDDILGEKSSLSKTEYGKELIEKIFHDNSIDHVKNYLESNGLLKTNIDSEDILTGDFVYFKSSFDTLDLDYLANLFSLDSISTISKMVSYEDLQKFQNYTPEQRKHANMKTEKLIIENTRKSMFGDHDILAYLIQGLKLLSPCKKLFIGKKFCAPVKDNYLRESIQEIGFKYSEDLYIFGKITSSTSSDSKATTILPEQLRNLTKSFNKLTIEMLNSEDAWIITPIALFFE